MRAVDGANNYERLDSIESVMVSERDHKSFCSKKLF